MTLGYTQRTNLNIPGDAKVVRTMGDWQIYHSPSSKSLYIYPTDYHVASLKLDSKDLLNLLKELDPGSEPGPAKPGDDTPELNSNYRSRIIH